MSQYLDDFPLLKQLDDKGRCLAYLDNAATTQKPKVVLEAMTDYYVTANANPHRGAYDLSIKATKVMDQVREKTKHWISGDDTGEIIFTKNASEGLNLVAQSYGMTFLKPGDEILLSIFEHHSNLVPWQVVAKAKDLTLSYLYPNLNGIITTEEIRSKITKRTKLVAIAQVSNVTGVINPVELIIEQAHRVGAVVVVDATQSAPHMPINVTELGADFYTFSGHKMFAPMGVGVLYGKKKLLQDMPPFLYGGDMIEYVEEQSATYASVPQKFEAGTPNLGSIAGLGAAMDYLNQIGMTKVQQEEQELTGDLMDKLRQVPYLKIIGPQTTANRIGVVAFTIEGSHPHDVATILDKDGVAIRSGNHCAQPLHRHLGVPATCRASISLYNTQEDIDRLVESLKKVRRWLGYGT